MMEDKKRIFSIFFRISALLAVLGLFCLFVCESGTAEFSISLVVVALNAIMATIAAVVIRSDKAE